VSINPSDSPEMNVGTQPLDALMEEKGLSNHDVVAASSAGFVNHKQVQKARKGRRLTIRMQEKVLEAFNQTCAPESFQFNELYTYRGKKTLK